MFFVAWHVESEQRDSVLERFVSTHAPAPEGARIVGRWHRADGMGGYMVLEASSMHAVTEFAYEWNDLLFVEIVPVVEDADLISVIRRLREKDESP